MATIVIFLVLQSTPTHVNGVDGYSEVARATTLTVRHLEFEKETAGPSTHTVGSRIFPAACTNACTCK